MAAEEAVVGLERSASTADAQVFDMSAFLGEGGGVPAAETLATCQAMAEYIARTGILVIRDPRVSSDDNDGFLQMMQRYYSQPLEALMADARPDIYYQVCAHSPFEIAQRTPRHGGTGDRRQLRATGHRTHVEALLSPGAASPCFVGSGRRDT